MAQTSKELKNWFQDKIKAGRLSWTAQNDVSFERGLHFKFDQQLLDGIELYDNKCQRLIDAYKEYLDEIGGKIKNFDISKAELKDDLLSIKDKIIHMADKYWALKWEIEGRKLDIFKRKPVGTIYYIDLDGGNDGNDGLSIGQAWLTINKYTHDSFRSAGDIAKVRAGTTEVKIDEDVTFDEDGNGNNYIEIRGCSVADDPWGDASDVKPSISFNDSNYKLYPQYDNRWKINRLIMKESAYTSGTIRFASANIWHFLDCEITDNSNVGGEGTYLSDSYGILIENTVFQDNKGRHISLYTGSTCKLINCDFNGGATGTQYAIFAEDGFSVEAIDCRFGQVTPQAALDIDTSSGANGMFILRNCKYNSVRSNSPGVALFSEDDNGVYGAHKMISYKGTATKDTSIKTGNASFSCKFEPNTYCGIVDYLTLNNDSLINHPFNVLCTSGVEKTVTIKIRSLGAWAAYPTNTELYVEFSYLSNGASAARTKIASVQVLSDETTWVSFTVTFTPLQTGMAYGTVYLKKYQIDRGIYVNMEAT